jgi:hypothetical protein
MVGLALVAATLSGIAVYGRVRPRLVTDSDFAVIELHTELATRGKLRLGPYSRFGWNHPGPLLSYVQAPFYAVGGRNAVTLFAVALLINICAVLMIGWCAWRERSRWVAAAMVTACVVLAWRAPRLLASPWTGHVPILGALAVLVVTAAVASGRIRLLPVMIAAGSLAAQTHVALVPMVAVLGSLAVVHTARTQGSARILGSSALLGAALWLPTLADAVMNRGGNLAALWQFFVIRRGEGHDLAATVWAWSSGLTGVLRPDFALPWGGHVALRDAAWVVPCAIAQMILLIIAWRLSRRAGRRFEAMLALCAFVVSITGLWATSRIEGPFLDHELFWLSAIGAINMAIIAAILAGALLAKLPSSVADRAPAVVCAAVLASICLVGLAHLRDITSFESRRTIPRRIPLAHAAIRDYKARTGADRLLIEMQDEAWSEGAGIVLRLYQDDTRVAVPDTHRAMFTDEFRPTGWENARITISPRHGQHRESQARPGNVTLLEADPVFVNAIRLVPGR